MVALPLGWKVGKPWPTQLVAVLTSWYCYDPSTGAHSDSGSADLDLSFLSKSPYDPNQNLHVGMLYTQHQIAIYVNGTEVFQMQTPDCLKQAEMKLIASVEGGATLPEVQDDWESGTVLGAMVIKSLRKWAVNRVE